MRRSLRLLAIAISRLSSQSSINSKKTHIHISLNTALYSEGLRKLWWPMAKRIRSKSISIISNSNQVIVNPIGLSSGVVFHTRRSGTSIDRNGLNSVWVSNHHWRHSLQVKRIISNSICIGTSSKPSITSWQGQCYQVQFQFQARGSSPAL